MAKKILAPIFTDNMVLQRDKKIKLWGNAAANSHISITLGGISASADSDGNGDWYAEFPPMQAADGLTLVADDGTDKVTLGNIAIGEVWLAGGQSNMEFELSRCTDWERIKANSCPAVRFFYTPKHAYEDDAYRANWESACWQTCGSDGFANWSAVGYIFAEKISAALGVTVGIIGCNWGGTSASVWMSREAITADKDTRIYIDEFDERNSGISLEKQKREYLEYVEYESAWDERCNELYRQHPDTEWSKALEICGECKWPGPINSFNSHRPCGQYRQMIRKICPYTLRGFIYYQGENDDHRPDMYGRLLTNLIRLWRNDWQDDGLEFIITQLTMHRYSADPDYKNWPIIREAQLETFRNMPHTGIAIIPDCGQFNEVHPTNKTPVGERLALQALWDVYGLIDADDAFGPLYSHKEIHGNVLEVFFEHTKNGLTLKGEPECYEIAGADGVFYPATVNVKESSVEFKSDKVDNPMYARYCWSNYCNPTLYAGNGLPASPFRTDI